jgi:putative tryptophan/tyrosine transport system substrate-binding protein
MHRRSFLGGALVVLAVPRAGGTQAAAPVPKIGYLSPWSSSNDPSRLDAFRVALREEGYVDGTNVVVLPRFADEDSRRLPALAAELVQLKVDAIVALTTPVARVAQRATATIPIVFTYVSDAVRTGLVASLARPGGNLTGYSDVTADLVQKRLALLKEAVPRMTRVGVLKNPGNPGAEIMWTDLESAARQLRLELYGRDVPTAVDLQPAFAALVKAHVGSVIVLADFVLASHRRAIASLATSHRMPLMGWSRTWSDAGALLSYGAGTRDIQRRVAVYVAKILRGARPADLPVEEATRFELVVNLKTAKALGLTVPSSILARADEVIE